MSFFINSVSDFLLSGFCNHLRQAVNESIENSPLKKLLMCFVAKGDAYRMSSKPRGRAIIINNRYFTRSKQRDGCEYDIEELESLFTGLHFNVEKHENYDATVSVFCNFFFYEATLQPEGIVLLFTIETRSVF